MPHPAAVSNFVQSRATFNRLVDDENADEAFDPVLWTWWYQHHQDFDAQPIPVSLEEYLQAQAGEGQYGPTSQWRIGETSVVPLDFPSSGVGPVPEVGTLQTEQQSIRMLMREERKDIEHDVKVANAKREAKVELRIERKKRKAEFAEDPTKPPEEAYESEGKAKAKHYHSLVGFV
jgi:hypothetical protein